MTKSLFLCVFGLLIFLTTGLHICREHTHLLTGGNNGHDWILFDDHVFQKSVQFILRVARRYQAVDPEFLASHKRGVFASGDKAFVSVSLDGSYEPATVVDQIKDSTGRKIIGYTVVRNVLLDKYIEDKKELKKSKRNSQVKQSGSADLVDFESYKNDLTQYNVWGSEIYPKCINAAVQKTLGFHSIKKDSEGVNGLRHDDDVTLRTGCPDKIRLPVDDKYARAAVFLLCQQYMNPKIIRYDTGLFSKIKKFLTHKSKKYLWEKCPNKKSFSEMVKNKKPKKVLCWDFIQDLHDILCEIKNIEEGTKEDELYTSLFYGNNRDPGKFRVPFLNLVESKPLLEEVTVESQKYDENSCVVPVTSTSYQFREQESIVQANQLRAGQLPEEDAAQSRAVDEIMANIKPIPPKSKSEPFLMYPVAELDKKIDPKIGKDPEGLAVTRTNIEESDELTQLFMDNIQKFPCAVAVMKVVKPAPFSTGLTQVVTDYAFPKDPSAKSNSSFSNLASSKQSTTAILTYSAYKSVGKSQLSVIAAANFLDRQVKSYFKVENAGQPLRVVAKMLGGIKFAFARVLMQSAKKWGLCVSPMTEEDCMCKIVDPLSRIMDDLFLLKSPLEGSNGAVTVLLVASVNYGISYSTESYGGGVYFTYEWLRNGEKTFNLEIGGLFAHTKSFRFGSTIAAAATSSISFQLGLFYGRGDQISNYGADVGGGWGQLGSLALAISFLFRAPFIDQLQSIQCRPDETISPHAFVWPVAPKCIRGFTITLTTGAALGVSPINLDVGISVRALKQIPLWTKKNSFKRNVDYYLEQLNTDLDIISQSDPKISNMLT